MLGVHTSTHGLTCYFGMLVHTIALRAGMLACLCCWGAPQHAIMPTTRVLTCWGAPQQRRQTSILGPPPSLAGHRPACQHASMSTTRVLACWDACQQHRQTSILGAPPSLAGHRRPACQHAYNGGVGMLGCMPTAQTDQHS